MGKIKSVIIFDNGNLAVFDTNGEQVAELQESWVNFAALRKLAKVVARDNPEITGSFPLHYNPLMDYVDHYKKYPSKPAKPRKNRKNETV